MQAGDRIGGRYVLELELGAGSGGQVYRALDTRTQTLVALKFLSAGALSAAAIERAGLLTLEHPALVRMLDSGSHGAQAYVVSELVPAGSLTALPKPVDSSLLEQIAAQMLAALAFLHGQGILHADVKTENIFVASVDPPVFKLGDFGLSRRIREIRAGDSAGSPAFMPPEVIRGEPVDERSDLYALGVVLYECAFGRLPFESADVSTVFLGHLTQEPEALRNPGAVRPRELALLRRLLAKDPAARPRDARAALTAWRGEEAAVPESALPRLGVLIGRDDELAACERALSGRERVVVLEGPAGAGKTRLLRELALRAGLQDVRVVWWTPDTVSGEGLSFAPSLTHPSEPNAAGPRDPRDAALDRSAALRDQLGDQGWLVLVDDLAAAPAWFTQSVVEFCRMAVTTRADGNLVCLASRTALLPLEHGFLDMAPETVVHLTLGAWTVEAVTSALSALYGTRGIDPSLAAFVRDTTGGNPSLVELIAPRLIAQQALRATPSGQLTITADASAQTWSGFADNWIAETLSSLAPGELRLLRFLSALRTPADSEFLSRLVPNVDTALAMLLRTGFAHAIPGAGAAHYAVAGEILRGDTLGRLLPGERAQLHAEIVTALQGHPAADPDELLYHQALCADPAGLLPLLETLAHTASPEALRQVHDTVAARWATELSAETGARLTLLRLEALHRGGDIATIRVLATAALTSVPAQFRNRVGCYLADAQMELGEPEAALTTLSATDVRADPESATRAARALWMMRRYEEGLAVTSSVLETLARSDAPRHSLVGMHTTLLRALGRADEAMDLAMAAADGARTAGAQRDLADLLISIGQIYFYRGDFERAELNYRHASDLMDAIGDRIGLLRALNSLAAAAGELGRYLESREHLLRALDLSRGLGEFRTLSTLHGNLALLSHLLGRHGTALEHVFRARQLLERTPNHNTSHGVHLIETMVRIRLGDFGAAQGTLNRLLKDSPDALATAQIHALQASLDREFRRFDAADAALDRAAPLLLGEGAVDELIELDLCRARIAGSRGDRERALALADAVVERSQITGGWLQTIQSKALLAEISASFDPDVGAALAAQCLEVTEANSLREEAWRLHRILGMCHQRRGDAARCRLSYQRAWQTIEEIAADLPDELATGYFQTPDVSAFIAQFESVCSPRTAAPGE